MSDGNGPLPGPDLARGVPLASIPDDGVLAGRVRPVILTGVSPMDRSNSVPDSTLSWPGDFTAQVALGHRPKPATTPPAARPCTKRRRDISNARPALRSRECDDMGNSTKSVRLVRAEARLRLP